MSMNDIATDSHISKHSVSEVCRIAQKLGITEDEVSWSDNGQLYRRFFPDKRTAQEFYEPADYDYVLRKLRTPGDRMEVDWSGPAMHYLDRYTGRKATAYLFCSNLAYSRLLSFLRNLTARMR